MNVPPVPALMGAHAPICWQDMNVIVQMGTLAKTAQKTLTNVPVLHVEMKAHAKIL